MDDNLKNNGGEPLENEKNTDLLQSNGDDINGTDNTGNDLPSGGDDCSKKDTTEPVNVGESIYSSPSAPKTPPMKSAGDEKAKKRTAAIIITVCVLGVLVTVLGIIGIVRILHSGSDDAKASDSSQFESVDSSANFETPTGDIESTTEAALESTTSKKPETTGGSKQTTARNIDSNTQATINELPPLTKTGDNILSDSPDNEFIKIIVKKYKVDAKNLVAIYAVPDKGNNFVLEFSGKTDADGNVIKSPDTLKRVHQIDKDRNVTTATGTITGNVGVSYAEGKLVFYLVTNVIMPQYPDYFTGVEPLEKSKNGN